MYICIYRYVKAYRVVIIKTRVQRQVGQMSEIYVLV